MTVIYTLGAQEKSIGCAYEKFQHRWQLSYKSIETLRKGKESRFDLDEESLKKLFSRLESWEKTKQTKIFAEIIQTKT